MHKSRYGVKGRIIFANKLDRTGASFGTSVSSILQNQLHPRPLVLTVPVASFEVQKYTEADPGIEGIVDLVKWELWRWNLTDGEHVVTPLPRTQGELDTSPLFLPDHPLLPHLVPARQQLLESLSMVSDPLMDTLLEDNTGTYLDIKAEDIMPSLRTATMNRDVLPVLCGSAWKHIGTDLVLDYVGELLASPVDVAGAPQTKDSPLHAFVWKVGWDERKGWMSFVRIYSGLFFFAISVPNIPLTCRRVIAQIVHPYEHHSQP